jgi:PilZ domain
MTDSARNQRHFSRVPFDTPVRMISAHGSTAVRLLNISLKGALVSQPPGWVIEPGTLLALELTLVDNEHIRVNVKVAHAEHGHVGLFWDHIDLDSMTHLRRLVQLNLGDAAQLDRELAAMR